MRRSLIQRMIAFTLLVVVSAVFLAPFAWAFLCSLKSKSEVYTVPPRWDAAQTFRANVRAIADAMLPKPPVRAWEGFETDLAWKVDGPGDAATLTVNTAPDGVSVGQRSLRMASTDPRRTRSRVHCDAAPDLSEIREIVFDAYAEQEGLAVSLAFGVTATYQRYESPPVRLAKGWNRGVSIDLTAEHFTTESRGAPRLTELPSRDDVRRLSVVLHHRPGAGGVVCLDNIRLRWPWWRNYHEVFRRLDFALFFRNSFIICILATLGQLLSSSLVAFGFARVRFFGRDALFVLVLATMMIPYQVTMIPLFLLFREIGWVDSFLPLIVPQFFGAAFNIFLLRQFFRTIPYELDEAAVIDGCSRFGVYWRILLPLSKPAMVVVAIFTFLWHWRDLMGPLIYLDSLSKRTVALGIAYFRSPYETGMHLIMAAAIAALIPVVALFFIGQKYILKGITLAGVRK